MTNIWQDDHYEVMTERLAKEMTDRAYRYLSAQANYTNSGAMSIVAKAYSIIGTTKSVVVRGGNILITA